MKNLIFLVFTMIYLSSCGIYKYSDAKKNPVNADERVKKNIEEGRGFRLGELGKRGGDFMFSSSNPMWRASLEILDFLPMTTVDYSGGVIISDWYTDDSDKDQALKVTVRFLSNQVRANSLKVTVHRKRCSVNQSCKVELFKSRIQQELIASILREAAILEKQKKE